MYDVTTVEHYLEHVDDIDSGLSIIRHPLLVTVHFSGTETMNMKMINQQFRNYSTSLEEGNLSRALALIEKPYKLLALEDLLESGQVSKDDPNYWSVVFHSYSLVEAAYDDRDRWLSLMDGAHDNREFTMEADEYQRFQALPEVVTVYRGAREGVNEDGISFSLSPEKAEWFANRFDGGFAGKDATDPVVIVGQVKKSDIMAYIAREDEVVINPSKLISKQVINLTTEEIPSPQPNKMITKSNTPKFR